MSWVGVQKERGHLQKVGLKNIPLSCGEGIRVREEPLGMGMNGSLRTGAFYILYICLDHFLSLFNSLIFHLTFMFSVKTFVNTFKRR